MVGRGPLVLGRFFRPPRALGAVGPLARILVGVVLAIAGLLFTVLEVGVLLIADCGPDCVARGERLLVGLLIAAGAVVTGAGVWLVATGVKARRQALES